MTATVVLGGGFHASGELKQLAFLGEETLLERAVGVPREFSSLN